VAKPARRRAVANVVSLVGRPPIAAAVKTPPPTESTPVRGGSRPVSIAALEALQQCHAEYQAVKVMPSAASRSMFGDLPAVAAVTAARRRVLAQVDLVVLAAAALSGSRWGKRGLLLTPRSSTKRMRKFLGVGAAARATATRARSGREAARSPIACPRRGAPLYSICREAARSPKPQSLVHVDRYVLSVQGPGGAMAGWHSCSECVREGRGWLLLAQPGTGS
jgi:hypothetical protein